MRHRNKVHLIASFFSGLKFNLANSAYHACHGECGAAAYALRALAGMPYEQFKTCLRDVFVTVYEQYDDRPPAVWKCRAEHYYYTEQARVEAGVETWYKDDLVKYGSPEVIMWCCRFTSIVQRMRRAFLKNRQMARHRCLGQLRCVAELPDKGTCLCDARQTLRHR